MTRIKGKISIITAIILCILTLVTSMGSLALTKDDLNCNAQFFAMHLSNNIKSVPAPTLSGSASGVAITWLRPKEPVTGEEDVYKLAFAPVKVASAVNEQIMLPGSKARLYNCKNYTSYYMRI